MNRERKGIIIISICFIVLFTMFLIQLPNEEIKLTQPIDTSIPVVFNGVISTNAHNNYENTSSYIFINSSYMVAAGGGGGGSMNGNYAHIIITK